MKNKIFVVSIVCVITIMIASSAFGWRSVRTGQKNFERAWSAYLFKRPEKANEYFVKAADAFSSALAEVPPSRTTMFASNLAMAGISLYQAGSYKEAIDAMNKAKSKDRRLWEAYLYSGLSYAHLNEKQKAIESFSAYMNSSPTQAILSTAVSKQINILEQEGGSLEAAIIAIDTAAFSQYTNNYLLGTPDQQGRCSGVYWWRYNKGPCSERNDSQYIRK